MKETNISHLNDTKKELLALKLVLVLLIGSMDRQLSEILISSISESKNMLNEVGKDAVLPEDIEEIIEMAKQMIIFK